MAKLLLLSLLLSILLLPTTAEIKNLKISRDNRPIILFEKFGFTHTGHVAIAVSNVSLNSNLYIISPKRLGFFLSEESLIQPLLEIQQNPSFCVLDSRYISLLFTFGDLLPSPEPSFNKSYPVSAPKQYSLFFANCIPESQVSMDVRIEVYNLENGMKEYLPAGLT